MKKLFSMMMVLVLLVGTFSGCGKLAKPSAEESSQSAEGSGFRSASNYYIIQNVNTGVTVASERSEEPAYLSTLTHLMVALVVMEKTGGDLSKEIQSNEDTFGENSTNEKIGVRIAGEKLPNIDMAPGETYTTEELLSAMLIYDAYDAANLLAQSFGEGDIGAFINAMNEKAKTLGMDATVFTSPNGMPSKNQGGTAADVAKLSMELIGKYRDIILPLTEQKEREIPKKKGQNAYPLVNRNPLINDTLYEGQHVMTSVKGLKYSNSPFDKVDNVVVYAEEGGESYIGVFMGAPYSEPTEEYRAIFQKNPPKEEEAKVPPAEEESSKEESSTDEVSEAPAPPEASARGQIFGDVRYLINEAFTKWLRVQQTDSNVLFTIKMAQPDLYDYPEINIGLEVALKEGSKVTGFLCERPEPFQSAVKKGQEVGKAIPVGDDTVPSIKLVALNSSDGSAIISFLIALLRIVFIVIIFLIALIVFIRWRNINIQKKRKAERAKRAAAVRQAQGRVLSAPKQRKGLPPGR